MYVPGLCVCGASLSVSTEHIFAMESSVNAHHSKSLEQNRPANRLKWLVLAKKRVCIN